MTRRTVTENETCAQVVVAETMPATTDKSKEETTMTVENKKRAKRRPTREQKARWKTNALMKKYDDETKATALRVYTEALDYGEVKGEATLDQAEEYVRDYLWGDWTFDDIWDLAREFGVKPRGFHDNSWDMGEGYDGEIIDRLSDIISKIGSRLRESELSSEKTSESSDPDPSGLGEKTETTKEETTMTVTKKEVQTVLSETQSDLDAKRKKFREIIKASERPVIGVIHGKAIQRIPEYNDDMIDVEAMERESEGLKKLYPDEWELELEALNRAELDYLCRKFGIKVTQETPKAEKRQKLLKYLEEGGKNKVA